MPTSLTPSTPHKNLFTYMSPRHHHVPGYSTPSRTPHGRRGPNLNTRSELYSLSPVRLDSQRMLLSPRKQPRAVSKVPYKVLDAPDLQDDFYLNLVDWGSSNILGVGLGSCVYMWNSRSGEVTKLCDLQDDMVTSVSWIQRVRHHHFNHFSFHLRFSLTDIELSRAPTSASAPPKATSKSGTPSAAAVCGR